MPQTNEPPEPFSARPLLAPSSFPQFHDAYIAVLEDLLRHPHHHTTTQGNSGPERLNVSFEIADPAARVPLLATYTTNVVVHLAETLWLLGGRDDVAMMRHYAPRLASYSVDGLTIAGAAYGTRLFRTGTHAGDRCAFDATLDLIRSDPDTRRAVLPIFGAHEVGDGQHPDVSCTIAFQLLQRDGALHGICYTRAKDASRGLVSDVFSFTFIQELAARLLGLRLGTYTHHVGSMHIINEHLPRTHAILAEAAATVPPLLPWPKMPAETTMEILDEVCAHEQRLRANLMAHTKNSLERSGLPQYWQGLIALLEIYRQITYEPDCRSIDPEIITVLHPAHQWMSHHTWPDRVPPAGDRRVAS
ncbi:thymidylate synthase [Amycolatopsis palatopharyngis]|uniref:thymidylate synthase n=1 Tax=Amycolatopsis palatopharyngis TaxID=187982 RepID=UPI000E26DE59|nr:thymidylate synthase [Amycolatopsis palatopharyngis]